MLFFFYGGYDMEKVKEMPIRAVITKKVVSSKWSQGVFLPGTVADWNKYDFDLFVSQYPDCIKEIEMSEQDWINLATDNARKAQQRIWELEKIYGEKFISNNYSVIPDEFYDKVDGFGYSGGLEDAYRKTKLLLDDVDSFERQCVANYVKSHSNNLDTNSLISELDDKSINSSKNSQNNEENVDLNINLKKDNYFDHGNRYFVEFNYANNEQQNDMYNYFKNGLLVSCGANSSRAKAGQDFLMPYFIDDNHDIVSYDTGIIGGSSIPEDLLAGIIKKFVEVDNATINIGNEQIKYKFDYDEFLQIIGSLDNNLTR
jgi:hypothetical protein